MITLAQLRRDLTKLVQLGRDDRTIGVCVSNPPRWCDDDNLKIAVFGLSQHVEKFRELHTHDQVQLAREALAAGYIYLDPKTENAQ